MRWVKCLINRTGRNERLGRHDQPGVMNEQLPDLDPFTVDQLLDGAATDPLVSPVLDALGTPALASEVEGASSAAACIAAAIPAPAVAGVPTRGIRRLTTRTGALAAAGALAFSGVAAAASGVPVPVVQGIFDTADEPVLIEVDDPDTKSLDELEQANLVGDDGDDSDVGADDDAEKDKTDQKEETDKADKERKDNHGAAVSEAAKSDCGKKPKTADTTEEPAVEVPVDPACDADNHGAFVKDVAKSDVGKTNNTNKADKTDDVTDAESSGGSAEDDDKSIKSTGGGNGNGKAKGKNKGG